eukprot:5300024-Pleurochrysis_carterae.AAC.2
MYAPALSQQANGRISGLLLSAGAKHRERSRGDVPARVRPCVAEAAVILPKTCGEQRGGLHVERNRPGLTR